MMSLKRELHRYRHAIYISSKSHRYTILMSPWLTVLCINLNKRYILISLFDEVSQVFKKKHRRAEMSISTRPRLTSFWLFVSLLCRVRLKKLFILKLVGKFARYTCDSCLLFVIRANIRNFAYINR